MGKPETVFRRHESKYRLTGEQHARLMERLAPHVVPDRYGEYTICNVYYDTDTYDLIRASLDKPLYKEKLRLRSYGVPAEDDPVFVEIKKKYRGIVYKRREVMPLRAAEGFLAGGPPPEETLIAKELAFALQRYRPRPAMFIASDRTAFDGAGEPELRITFDRNIRSRPERLDLRLGDAGDPLLPQGEMIMEIKTPFAMPLWLVNSLSETGVRPTSFSKYGTAYQRLLADERG